MDYNFRLILTCTLVTCLMFRNVNCSQNTDDKFPTALHDVVFVLLSQTNSYHRKLAEIKKQEFLNQINSQSKTYFLLHEKWPDMTGGWTLFPVISSISNDEQLNRKKWMFILEEFTSFDVDSVVRLLQNYDPLQEHFLGHALWDSEPTIIHHFAFVDEPSSFLYPDTAAGVILSMTLAKNISKRQETEELPDFSIDSKHELAQFIWDRGRGTRLQNVPGMCLKKVERCSTWVQKTPACGTFEVTADDVYFAVKTCSKFHSERVPVVKNTWAKDTRKLAFYSDTDDSEIPTINTGILNTDRGHCAKTLAILKHVAALESLNTLKWVVVADDDTLISVKRLTRLLSCYNASEDVALGERYGYNAVTGDGYDYITGGGGMVFSVSTVKKMISNRNCYCPSLSAPDDMTLGICLKKLGIPVTHSPLFHQARPVDYSPDFLSYWAHISFHKFWMIEPLAVYQKWLNHLNENARSHAHNEL